MKKQDISIITRYLANELSEVEKESLLLRLDNEPNFKELFMKQYDLWVKTGVTKVATAEEKQKELDRIWYKIRQNKPKNIYLKFIRYAAVFILSLLLGGTGAYIILRETQYKQSGEILYVYSSGSRSISDITLPDGSKVKLNANTTIKYSQDEKRKVEIEGEATFEVVHDEKRPFFVDCDELVIVDVGTLFNVKARTEDEFVETILMEGVVDLHVENQKQVSMQPGQKAVFSKVDKKIELEFFDHQESLAWSQNRFYFKGVKLEKVLSQLADWYEVEVVWKNKALKNREIYYNASRGLSLQSTMELLDYLVEIKYEIKEQEGDIPTAIIIY